MKKKIIIVLIVLFIFITLAVLQTYSINIDIKRIKNVITEFGAIGPIVFIILNILTIIFSPLTSFPFWLVSLALFGFWPSFFYILIGNSIGNAINFLIAKHYGRPVVKKFVGEKSLKKIDEITQIVGLKTLFIARLFGGAATDYISYAAGLTSIKFKPYLLITLLVSIPSILINVYAIHKAITIKPTYLIIFGIWGYAAAILIPLFSYKTYQSKNSVPKV